MKIAHFKGAVTTDLATWTAISDPLNIKTVDITFANDLLFTELSTGQTFEHEIIGYTLHGRITWKDSTAPADKKYLAIALGANAFTADGTDVIVCGNDAAGTPKVGAYDAKTVGTTGAIVIDGTNDVKIVDAGTSYGTNDLSCAFTRLLKTGDTGDQDIVDGDSLVIAWGTGDNTNIKEWGTVALTATKSITIVKQSVVTILAKGKTFTHKVNDEKLIGVL